MRWQQFHKGARLRTGEVTVDAAAVRAFAEAFDPQPLHLDAAAAAAGPFGGVIASGFHTLALSWRLWVDVGALGDDGMAGLGVQALRWLRPVRASDRLAVEVEVLEVRPSASHPGAGIVRFRHEVRDQEQRPVMTYETAALVRG